MVDPKQWECNLGKAHSTTPLKRHLESAHRNPFTQWEVIQDELEASGKKPQKNNLITSKFLLTKEDVKAAEEKQLMCLMEFVVGSFLPISICENVQFRQLIESHNPDAIPCSRENLRGVIVKKAASMRLLAKDFLSGRNVAITTDCWTSRANEPYISLTAHLIEGKYERGFLVLFY